MKSFSLTDVGQVRSQNQDYVYASEQPIGNLPNLFVLADGMGGHNAGDFASRCAVSVIEASVKKDMSFNPIKIMRHAIEEANEKIHELAKADAGKAGMGTTLVAVTVVGYYAYVANVGDSRLYISGEQGLVQITRDHSWIAEMVMRGELSKEEARNHPDKNIITRALGASEEVDIDFFDVQLEEKNRILLCSDGLSNMVADEEIQKILGDSPDIEQSGRQLVATANTNGGRDNISVILDYYEYDDYDYILNIADHMATGTGIVSPAERIADIATRRILDPINRGYFLAELTNTLIDVAKKMGCDVPEELQPKVYAAKGVTLEEISEKFEKASEYFYMEYLMKI